MKVPLSWLKEYVDVKLPAKELAHRLTMAGIEASGITVVGGAWDNVFVARVVKVERHPNADRLRLATVDLGSETLTVVCGAPNVAEGQKVPFAKVGAKLLDPHSGGLETLKPARIRGVVSEGMVCSQRELGLGDDHTGIVVLGEDAPVGAPLSDYLGDVILDLEVTANRPDCLSILGIAHEVAALTGGAVREPSMAYAEEGEPVEKLVTVEIADPDLCSRYTASVVSGVKVGPSPRWLQERLLRAGQRPINNVVDVTNYVMLEYGQPLHAFDYAALADKKIIVRKVRAGEVFTTLDGVERKLDPPVLVIADARRAVALAGVMGGANSEMTEATTSVLLESATFNPINTRRTALALKLRSEASTRFEKGLSPDLAPLALRRATQLIIQLAGGKAAPGVCDVYPGEKTLQPIRLTLARLGKVLGMDLLFDEARGVLDALGFQCRRADDQVEQDILLVTPPYWRTDVTIEDDLVEEVARIIGYDRIPTTLLRGSIPQHQLQPLRELRERVKDLLVALGLQEVITYSLTSRTMLEKVAPLTVEPLKVANPMSAEQEYLRTTLRTGLLLTLAENIRNTDDGLRLFEAGRVYLPQEKELPKEREAVAGVLSGPPIPLTWLSKVENARFFDAKGTVEAVLAGLGLVVTYEPAIDPTLHPGRCATIKIGDVAVGVLGEVHPKVLAQFDIEVSPVAYFEVDMDKLLGVLPTQGRQYKPITRLPASVRDIAVVVDRDVPAARLQDVIRRHPMVDRAVLFDVYEGERIPQGKKSLAYRIYFTATSETLTADEINEAQDEIVHVLEQELGAVLRR